MIIARVYGGLGNQMFQYALGRHLALRRGVSLWLDTSWYRIPLPPGLEPRTFGLDRFRIASRTVPRWLAHRLPQAGSETASPRRRAGWAALRPALVTERGMAFDPDVLEASSHAVIDGYWQSERYFQESTDAVRADFRLRSPLSARGAKVLAEIKDGPSVSLHIRRGDYVTNPASAAFHGTFSVDWYAEAVAVMLGRVGAAQVFVFSDDLDWARVNLGGIGSMTFVDGGEERPEEDLHLMAACQHHIIANSSFSWWAAWLNPSPRKEVIAPKRWFLVEADLRDRLPTGWRLL